MALTGTPRASRGARLIVRADDFGMCQAVNRGILKSWRHGIVTTTNLMAPCPWFWEAAKICRENPSLDVGIHLTLFSEWRQCRWRPLSPLAAARSFTDSRGCLQPDPQTLLRARPDWGQVEKEFLRQIALAREQGAALSHISLHWTRPHPLPRALRAVLENLSRKLDLPVSGWGETAAPLDFMREGLDPAARGAFLLKDMRAELHLAVVHPALDSPEPRSLSTRWRSPYRMEHRFRELAELTQPGLRRFLKASGIRLVGYRDLRRSRG